MAIGLDASAPANVTNTSAATTTTTASFTPPTGAVLLACYISGDIIGGIDESATGCSNTGTAATWTRRARKSRNAGSTGGASTVDGSVEFWTATAPGGAITVSFTNASSNETRMVNVQVLTGADTSALTNVAAAQGSSGLPSVTVPSCLVGSYVFACSNDNLGKGNGLPGSAQVMVSEFTSINSEHLWRTAAGLLGPTSQTMNLTAPAAQSYIIVGIEIRQGATIPPDEGSANSDATDDLWSMTGMSDSDGSF